MITKKIQELETYLLDKLTESTRAVKFWKQDSEKEGISKASKEVSLRMMQSEFDSRRPLILTLLYLRDAPQFTTKKPSAEPSEKRYKDKYLTEQTTN